MLFLRIHVFTQRGGGGITATPGPPLATPPEFKKVASEDVNLYCLLLPIPQQIQNVKGCLV